MLRHANLLWFLAFAFLLCGCSGAKYSTVTNPNVDFTHYMSFYCADSLEDISTKMPRYDNRENRILIKEAIIKEMENRNYIYQENGSDLLVEFIILIEIKIDTVGQRTTDYRYWRGFETVAYNYKVGTLLINLIDKEEGILVWQGSAESVLEKEPKNEEKRLTKFVRKIFEKYPFSNAE